MIESLNVIIKYIIINNIMNITIAISNLSAVYFSLGLEYKYKLIIFIPMIVSILYYLSETDCLLFLNRLVTIVYFVSFTYLTLSLFNLKIIVHVVKYFLFGFVFCLLSWRNEWACCTHVAFT